MAAAAQARLLLRRERADAVVEAVDLRGVAVVADERGQHLDVPPGRAVGAALVAAVDVRHGRSAAPGRARSRQLDVDAAFRAAAEAAAAAGALAAEADHRVGALEQFGMVLDPLAQADVHALLVALGDDDQVDRQLAVHRLDRPEGVQLHHLRALGVGGAAAEHHLLVGRLLDQLALEGRVLPGVGLRDRHGVVHPVDQQGLLGAFVALGVDDRVAGRAVLGHAHVVDLRLLAAQFVEEALHHLRRFRDAFTGIGDAGLLNPLLQVDDVLIDVLVDVLEDLGEIRRHLAHVRLDLFVAVGPDAQLRCGGSRRPQAAPEAGGASGCEHAKVNASRGRDSKDTRRIGHSWSTRLPWSRQRDCRIESAAAPEVNASL